MKQVQWFPGHMSKARREMIENLKYVDIVFILLDARIPVSSYNPELDGILKSKPKLVLLNKCTLADPNYTKKWIQYYAKLGILSLDIDTISKKNIQKIVPSAKLVLKEKIEKAKSKGLKSQSIRAMVIGIPNVGKSTLINTLSKRKATVTGNRPGVTKSMQIVKITDDFELLDTPGVLWPKFQDEKIGYHLALTGAIKEDILPKEEVLQYGIQFLAQNYTSYLINRYGFPEEETYEDFTHVIEFIAKKRGALNSKGIDSARVYTLLLNDIRNSILGGITFDRP